MTALTDLVGRCFRLQMMPDGFARLVEELPPMDPHDRGPVNEAGSVYCESAPDVPKPVDGVLAAWDRFVNAWRSDRYIDTHAASAMGVILRAGLSLPWDVARGK